MHIHRNTTTIINNCDRIIFVDKDLNSVTMSGHGLIDMASYDKYLAGDLQNYELTDNDIRRNLDEIGNLV